LKGQSSKRKEEEREGERGHAAKKKTGDVYAVPAGVIRTFENGLAQPPLPIRGRGGTHSAERGKK